MTRALYTAAPETTGFGGDRLKLSLEFTPTSSSQTPVERAALRSFLARLRGRQNRAYLWDPSYRQRGSFPASELLTNNTFANGTTGWASSIGTALTAADRALRATRIAAGANSFGPAMSSAVTVVQYAPYAIRFMVVRGRGAFPSNFSITEAVSPFTRYSSIASAGMLAGTVVYPTTSFAVGLLDESASGISAGDYYEVPYTSLSRCALVDTGPNGLLHSDDFTNAVWVKQDATVTANHFTAPDGTVTGDSLLETATTAAHFVQESAVKAAVPENWVFSVAARIGDQANARSFVQLQLTETSSANSCTCSFNLSTGAIFGSVANNGTFANARAFIAPLGNGWYRCSVVGLSPATTTAIFGRIVMSTNGSTLTYAGSTSGDVGLWRATLSRSGVPTRLVQTTTTASSGTNQTGSSLHVKGLPASTNGLLLPDDRVEIITDRGSELKIVTAALDSDAAGLGFLVFEPPLRGNPADGAAVIVNQPMTRAIFAGDIVGFDDSPGIISTASCEFEEA